MKETTADSESGSYELALELTQATGRFSRLISQLSGSGYSLIAWRVLAELERNGPARISVLAQQQRVAQPSMTGLVTRLAGDGWVTREADPADGRATLVGLTAAGSVALLEYRSAAAASVQPELDALSASDRATLARAAELMHTLSDRVGELHA